MLLLPDSSHWRATSGQNLRGDEGKTWVEKLGVYPLFHLWEHQGWTAKKNFFGDGFGCDFCKTHHCTTSKAWVICLMRSNIHLSQRFSSVLINAFSLFRRWWYKLKWAHIKKLFFQLPLEICVCFKISEYLRNAQFVKFSGWEAQISSTVVICISMTYGVFPWIYRW